MRIVRVCDIGTLPKLYNLASRLSATRAHSGSGNEWSSDEGGYEPDQDTARLYLRDDPETLVWEEDDDRYLREHFGQTRIEAIAFFLNRTETAVAYRARQLGLRAIPKYYDAAKVAPWLGLNERELELLTRYGLEILPCTDRHGVVKIKLVSITSLARVLLRKRLWKHLVDKRDADEFFIRDVIESIAEHQRGEAVWEPSPWVSHGHTCLNPYSAACFGWFYNGDDEKMVGEDLDPRDLSPDADVTSDEWRRNRNGRIDHDAEAKELSAAVAEFVGSEA